MKKSQKRWTKREEIINKIDSLIESAAGNLAGAMREDAAACELRSEIGNLSRQDYDSEIQLKINASFLRQKNAGRGLKIIQKRDAELNLLHFLSLKPCWLNSILNYAQ